MLSALILKAFVLACGLFTGHLNKWGWKPLHWSIWWGTKKLRHCCRLSWAWMDPDLDIILTPKTKLPPTLRIHHLCLDRLAPTSVEKASFSHSLSLLPPKSLILSSQVTFPGYKKKGLIPSFCHTHGHVYVCCCLLSTLEFIRISVLLIIPLVWRFLLIQIISYQWTPVPSQNWD
jgi:hypothetical protein